MKKMILAIATLGAFIPGVVLAQSAQSPPTDPQSKRQQESPAVNNATGTPAAPSNPNNPAPTPDGTANTTVKTEPPITTTTPEGANPNAVTGGKTAPLAPKN